MRLSGRWHGIRLAIRLRSTSLLDEQALGECQVSHGLMLTGERVAADRARDTRLRDVTLAG